jgi:cytochrome c553
VVHAGNLRPSPRNRCGADGCIFRHIPDTDIVSAAQPLNWNNPMKSITKIALAGIALAFTAGTAFAATAAENWENSCASCHGADGKAQTKQGKKLKVRDYTDPAVQAEMKDDTMLKAILEGYVQNGKTTMKGFKDELSEDEAKDLVKFIRELKP